MVVVKTKNQITLLTIFILILVSISLSAQVDLNNSMIHETRIFNKNPISVIQSNYLDGNGSPSLETFLRTNGLFRQNSEIQSTPYFSVSIKKKMLIEKMERLV